MVYQTLLWVLLIEIGLVVSSVNGIYVQNLTNAAWDGVSFYISVKRETIQKKLHSSVTNGCGVGPKLFIPEKSVFPDLQRSDHHPVYVDFGLLTSFDFDEYQENNPDPCISVSGLEVSMAVPLLAASPNGPPVFALAMAVFYEKSRGDIPKPNFIYPYIPVDEIQLSDSVVVVKNGSEELRVSFIRHNHPCEPPPSIVTEEFDKFLSEEFQFGLPEPDFSFCDRHSFRSDYCTKAKGVKCTINRNAPNICQKYQKKTVKPCAASVDIVNITSGFREFMLLGNDPINILSSASYPVGPSLASLKSPCQE